MIAGSTWYRTVNGSRTGISFDDLVERVAIRAGKAGNSRGRSRVITQPLFVMPVNQINARLYYHGVIRLSWLISTFLTSEALLSQRRILKPHLLLGFLFAL